MKRATTLAREAFFLDFVKAIRAKFPDMPLMVTGGFRTRQGMEAAVAEGSCDLIGLARPAIINPLLPRTVLLNQAVPHNEAKISVRRLPPGTIAKFLGVKLIGVGPERVSAEAERSETYLEESALTTPLVRTGIPARCIASAP